MYLTPYSQIVREDLELGGLGLLITPQSHRPEQYDVADFPIWAADNGCFTLGDEFSLEDFLGWLGSFSLEARETCLFATAPDVVEDWEATLERSLPVLEQIRALGFPAAIVVQDGATVGTVPWDSIDAVFVGGSTEWKLSPEAEEILHYAEELGIWSHMGRVNSIKRMVEGARMGAWSVDGTLLIYGPEANAPRIRKAVAKAYEAYGDVVVPEGWNKYAEAPVVEILELAA